jgi:AraC-like DNA-binding protein
MSNALRIAHGTFGRVALLDMDRSLVRHAHPQCHMLIKVEGADTQFQVGDEMVALTDSQAVLIDAWVPHSYVHYDDSPRTVILALYIEPAWLKSFRSNWVASGAPGFFERTAGELPAAIRRPAMDLASVMMSNPGANSTQEQLLSDLVVAAIERFTAWRTVSASDRRAGDWRIRRIINAMRAQSGIAADIDSLAREAGLSRAHFYRLFNQATSMTPHVYLNMLRMELAVNSVVNNEKKLCLVSRQLGFSAPAHFARFFRDHAGVKPSQFRHVARMGTASAL